MHGEWLFPYMSWVYNPLFYAILNDDFWFAEKFNKNLEGPHYEQPKETDVYPSFAINHYAGRVSTGF